MPTKCSTSCGPSRWPCSTDGLVRANETLAAWLRREDHALRANNEHTPVRLIDFENPANNQFVVTNQWTYKAGQVGEAVRRGAAGQRHSPGHRRGEDAGAPGGDWVDGAPSGPRRLREERPGNVRAERVLLRHRGQGLPYGSVRMPVESLGPVASATTRPRGTLAECSRSVE